MIKTRGDVICVVAGYLMALWIAILVGTFFYVALLVRDPDTITWAVSFLICSFFGGVALLLIGITASFIVDSVGWMERDD